jgi:hypothetical protein
MQVVAAKVDQQEWRNQWVVQVVLGLPQIPGDQGKGAL